LDSKGNPSIQTQETSRKTQNGIRIKNETRNSDPSLAIASENPLMKGILNNNNNSNSINPNNNKSNLSNSSLRLSQWNGCSIQNEAKLNFIRSLPGDIVAIQESRKHSKEIASLGEILDFSERKIKGGGGSTTLSKIAGIQVLQNLQLNKDSHAVKVRYENTYFWLANIYLNKGTYSKIQKLFGKLRNSIPDNEWKILCCIGDFNVNVSKNPSEKELLLKLSKLMGLKLVTPTTPTRGDSTIDYILTGSKIVANEDSIYKGPSDHLAVTWKLQVEANERKKPIKIPSKSTADEITLALINNEIITKAEDFIQHFGQLTKRRKGEIMKIIKLKSRRSNELMDKLLKIQNPDEISKVINNHWNEFWKNTESTRYSTDSATAYKRLKNMLKYHLFEKRDGGIINCIKYEDGTIEQQPDKVSDELLKTMKEIQVDNKWKWLEAKEFPRLPELKSTEVELLMLQLSSNKAIAYDGLSNILFSTTKEKEKENSLETDIDHLENSREYTVKDAEEKKIKSRKVSKNIKKSMELTPPQLPTIRRNLEY